MDKEEENIIKKTCKELGLTYRELGEMIGVSESSIRSIASTNKISRQIYKSIELINKINSLEKDLELTTQLKTILKVFSQRG